MGTPCFNLIDEAWLPVANVGPVSLKDIFTRDDFRALGGTPVEKIAVMKLLLAIAQAAATPEDDAAWCRMGAAGMAAKCADYLEKQHEAFWLYGDAPFLQMPKVSAAKLAKYGSFMPEIAVGNTSRLTQFQAESPLSDAQRARVLLVNMSCCFSGKKTDSSLVLSPGWTKSASAKAGPALCSGGLLHTFLQGNTLWESIWLNMLTNHDLADVAYWPQGVGTPPWEKMPQGEDCETARALKATLMGRLVPMSRFMLLEKEGLHCTEGIQHADYLSGNLDPSAAGDFTGKKPAMLWCDPDKRPWRLLPSLLSFLRGHQKGTCTCIYLEKGIRRLSSAGLSSFGIWSGGIRVRSNAGEQYLSGTDDVVESEISLDASMLNSSWVMCLASGMQKLDDISKMLWSCVNGYYKESKAESAGDHAKIAAGLFWQGAERLFPSLCAACDEQSEEALQKVQNAAASLALRVYSECCPQDTARQIQCWAAHRPRCANKG